MTTPLLLSRLLTRPCTLVTRTPGPADAYGDPSWVETQAASTCYAEQTTPSEPGDPNYQGDDWRVVLAAGTAVDGLSAVIIDGQTFEVYGPPWVAKDPRSNADHHIELRARWTTP